MGHFETDTSGVVTSANRAFTAMTEGGRPVLGQPLAEVIGRGWGQTVAAFLNRLLVSSGEPGSLAVNWKGDDGAERHLLLIVSKRTGPSAGEDGFSGVMVETTSQLTATASAMAAFESQVSHMATLDSEGTVRLANQGWLATAEAGAAGADALPGGRYLAALARARDSGNALARLEEDGIMAVLEGRRRDFSMEIPLRVRERQVWLIETVVPLSPERPREGVLISRLDITERKLGEEELTTLYRAMDASVDGLAIIEADGSFLYINPAFAHLHGYEAPVELVGRTWRDLYPDSQWADLQDLIRAALDRDGYWTGELATRRRDGADIVVALSVTLLDRGELMVCSVRDVTAQKASERRLRESEAMFRAVFENIQEGIFLLDPEDLTILAANSALLSMFGFAAQPEVGTVNFVDFIHPEDRPGALENMRRVVIDDPRSVNRYRCTRLDGSPLWVETLGTPMPFRGRMVDLVAVTDVTARVEAERELSESEARLRAIIEGAQDSIFIKDPEGKYVLGNAAMGRLLGVPREEIPGKTDVDFFGARTAALIAGLDRRVLKGDSLEEEVTKSIRGEVHHFHTIKAPLRNAEGAIVGLCGIARDVTDRRRQAEALKASEERFRHIVENSSDFFFYVHDPQGNFKYISPGVESVMGYPVEFFLRPHESVAVEGPINDRAHEISERLVRGEIPPGPYQYEVRHRDGRTLILETFERPILKGGEVVEILGVCHNITPRLEMERSLEEYRRREFLGLLTQGLAHEVRNPLFNLSVTAQTIRKAVADKPDLEPLTEVLGEQVDRLAHLMRDVLDLGRSDDPSGWEVRSLKTLASEAIGVMEAAGGQRGRIRLVAGGGPSKARVNAPRIVEALCGLLQNALEFSPPGAAVDVLVERSGDRVNLEVADRGPGIPEALQDNVFKPFVSGRTGATGLGLAIVDRIARDHGGRTWFVNLDPPPGCRVGFSLPAVEEDEPEADGPLGSPRLRTSRKEKR